MLKPLYECPLFKPPTNRRKTIKVSTPEIMQDMLAKLADRYEKQAVKAIEKAVDKDEKYKVSEEAKAKSDKMKMMIEKLKAKVAGSRSGINRVDLTQVVEDPIDDLGKASLRGSFFKKSSCETDKISTLIFQ